MKKQIALLAIANSVLFSGCNLGTPGNDVQSTNNSTSQFALSLVAVGCKTISANGGKCTVVVTHSATDNRYLNQNLQVDLPDGYRVSDNDCKTTQNKSASCTITIRANAGTNNSKTAKIMINNYSETSISFTLSESSQSKNQIIEESKQFSLNQLCNIMS